MRRTVLLLAGVLLSVVALGSDSPKDYDAKTEYVGIEGTWQLIDLQYQGKSDKHDQVLLTFGSGNYTAKHNNRYALRGSYRISAARLPPYLDMIESSGDRPTDPFLYIYRIEDDTLWLARVICAAREKRPTGFDDNVVIEMYRRVRK